MKVSEIMSRHVEIIPPDQSLDEAAGQMRDLNIGLIPICDGDRLVGMLTDRDIVVRAVAEGRDPRDTPVSDVMTPQVRYCFEDQDVAEAARMMEEFQIRRLPILNRSKQLVGIVSLGDVAVRAGDDAVSGDTLKGVSEPSVR